MDDLSEIKAIQRETHALLRSHVKMSDERHKDVRSILDDHEGRLRKGESFRAKLLGWAVGAGVLTAGTAEAIKVKLGIM